MCLDDAAFRAQVGLPKIAPGGSFVSQLHPAAHLVAQSVDYSHFPFKLAYIAPDGTQQSMNETDAVRAGHGHRQGGKRACVRPGSVTLTVRRAAAGCLRMDVERGSTPRTRRGREV